MTVLEDGTESEWKERINMTRHEQLLEQYADTYFTLLMEGVSKAEGVRLKWLNIDDIQASKALDQRCIKTIGRCFAGGILRRSMRKALTVAAVVIIIMALSFTTAFAMSEQVRIATLNLMITVHEKYTRLSIQNTEVNTVMGVAGPESYFKNLRVEWLPKGYEYASGTYNYQAIFRNAEGEWIIIDRYDGAAQVQIDTENAEVVEPIEMNGSSGLCVVKNGQTQIIIYHAGRNIYVDIGAAKTVPRYVVEKVARNIVIVSE